MVGSLTSTMQPESTGNPSAMGQIGADLHREDLDLRKVPRWPAPEEVAELARVLLDKAKAGDVAACKLLLGYLVGQPDDG